MHDLQAAAVAPEQLAERVFNLSADKFLAVYRLYEQLGRQKEVEAEMQVLRNRLRRLRPRRAPTFTRLLCLPFEAFIADADSPAPYAVPRRHCRLLGRFVTRLMDAEEFEKYERSIAQLPIDDVASMLRLGGGFWRRAAQAIRSAEVRHSKRRKGTLRDSLELIAGCLDVGAQMANLTAGLPRERFRQLDSNAKDLVGRTIRSVPEGRLDDLHYPLVLLAHRLETPPAVIPLLQDQSIDIPNGVRIKLIAMMSRYLEMDLQAEVTVVEDIVEETKEEGPRALLQELLPSIQKALANRAAGVGGIPAQAVMDTAGEAVRDRIVAPAPDKISQKLDELLTADDGSGEPSSVSSRNEMRVARLGSIEEELATLADLMEHAESLGLRREIRQATESARNRIDETADDLMHTLDGVTSQDDIDEHRRNIYGMVRMMELLEGPDKADKLRLRCNSVIAAKANAA